MQLEAIKHEPRNWRMWDNLLTLALSVEDYSYAIVCYERLLEIAAIDYKLSIASQVAFRQMVAGWETDLGKFEKLASVSADLLDLYAKEVCTHCPPPR